MLKDKDYRSVFNNFIFSSKPLPVSKAFSVFTVMLTNPPGCCRNLWLEWISRLLWLVREPIRFLCFICNIPSGLYNILDTWNILIISVFSSTQLVIYCHQSLHIKSHIIILCHSIKSKEYSTDEGYISSGGRR